jgi:hypothetical protein
LLLGLGKALDRGLPKRGEIVVAWLLELEGVSNLAFPVLAMIILDIISIRNAHLPVEEALAGWKRLDAMDGVFERVWPTKHVSIHVQELLGDSWTYSLRSRWARESL